MNGYPEFFDILILPLRYPIYNNSFILAYEFEIFENDFWNDVVRI